MTMHRAHHLAMRAAICPALRKIEGVCNKHPRCRTRFLLFRTSLAALAAMGVNAGMVHVVHEGDWSRPWPAVPPDRQLRSPDLLEAV